LDRQRARAELHIGSRGDPSPATLFFILNLDDRMAQIRLTEGTLTCACGRLEQDEAFEIDTPNLAFSILRPATTRSTSTKPADTTVVSVRDGEGEVTVVHRLYIHPRETGTFAGIDQLDAHSELRP